MNSIAASQKIRQHLVPEGVVEIPGESPIFQLGALAGRPLLLVLRIADVIEQESLHVAIWGSADGQDWGKTPLFWFPQEYYRGVRPAALDLNQRPDVKFLKASWEVNRWGRGSPRPHFKFSVEIGELAEGA